MLKICLSLDTAKRFLLLSVIVLLCIVPDIASAKTQGDHWCGTRGKTLTDYCIKQHEFRKSERRFSAIDVQTLRQKNMDIGNIAVMRTDSINFIEANPFDLQGKKISFVRNTLGGFNVQVVGGSIGANMGSSITMKDDDSKQVNFTQGFSFPFNGKTYTSAFINSDGNITFGTGDDERLDRTLFRALSGAPRICPFFRDLNPEAGGQIKVLQTSTKFAVTWDHVSQFFDDSRHDENTFQVILYKNGNIDLIMGNQIDAKDAVIGISPGNASIANLKLINYSSTEPLTSVKQGVFERFTTKAQVDYAGLIQEFHQTHSAVYDFVVIWADFPIDLGRGVFAFSSIVQNNIQGIGMDMFNVSRFFNSEKLQAFLSMGFLDNYPSDFNARFLGENTTLDIVAHESGHRWLAHSLALVDGIKTEDMLGRQNSHWNFYMDSDASLLEGNDIRDNNDGTFTTIGAVSTYSKLDRYLMGFVGPNAVPPLFFVRLSPVQDKGRAPQSGVTFSGSRININMEQILQANGPRIPNASASQKHFKQAWILLIRSEQPENGFVERLDKIRIAFESFFHEQTGNHGIIDTTLSP